MDERCERLVTENTGLVHACAGRFKGKGIDYDDLYQNGCLGLVKAAKSFDESRGVKFSTYAVPVILGEIKRLFRDGGSVSVSRSLKELSYKTVRMKEKLTVSLGREPTLFELAEKMEVTPEEIGEALCVSAPVASLTRSDEDGEKETDIAAPDNMLEVTEKIALENAVARLDDRDKNLVQLRFYDGKTQCETAAMLGMTQVQVSRRERYIFTELRKMLA